VDKMLMQWTGIIVKYRVLKDAYMSHPINKRCTNAFLEWGAACKFPEIRDTSLSVNIHS
jgi:hypothetical protein